VKEGRLAPVATRHSTSQTPIVPPRVRYLAEIAETVRGYKRAQAQARLARGAAAAHRRAC
jgi:methylmalonyl-CoA mutase